MQALPQAESDRAGAKMVAVFCIAVSLLRVDHLPRQASDRDNQTQNRKTQKGAFRSRCT
jgi:hypothetical protein